MKKQKHIPNSNYIITSEAEIINVKTKKTLKHGIDKKGYHLVCLSIEGVKKTYKVHTLMGVYFLGYIQKGTNELTIDHIDNDKDNNSLENLQIITNRENCIKDMKPGKSKYPGVTVVNRLKSKYRARIKHKGKLYYLGHHKTELRAYAEYLRALDRIKKGLDPK